MGAQIGNYPPVYPDLSLRQEITLLQHSRELPWVVENVTLYYKPIVEPSFKLDRHFFLSNFYAPFKRFQGRGIKHIEMHSDARVYGYNLSNFNVTGKKKLLRNMVNPAVGEYILNTARQLSTETQLEMFG